MNIKYWVAIGKVQQMAFDDQGKPTRPHEVDAPVGNQHIVYQEMLLCKQSRNALKGGKKNKQSTRQTRFLNVPLCPECEKAYKAHPDLQWKKWENLVGV